MKVALIYDRVNKFGGAERVLSVLHEMYPDAPLYTAVYNRNTATWADDFDIRTTFLQNIPLAKTNHEYFAPMSPLAFESLDFSEYDLVISVTSEYAKGIITKPGTLHVCYCLTPTRYLWSGYDIYFLSDTVKVFSRPLISYLQSWDKVASQRPDYYIAISKTVKERIKKYYKRDSIVIYPPITLNTQHQISNTKQSSNTKYEIQNTGYFFIVSRLVPYKRIDIAIEAFNRLGLPLKIVGGGREFQKLKRKAGLNIEFLQNLTDEQLSRYYQDCIAFIFPGEEDLGLAILEAQSFGKPVIAYQKGGADETVIGGVTGEFFYPQEAQALEEAVARFDYTNYNSVDCQKQAAKFSKESFKKHFMETIQSLLKHYRRNL